MPSHAETVTSIKKIIIDTLGWDVSPADFPGRDLPGETKMDSTQALDVILAMEEQFGITVDDTEVSAELFASVDTLAQLVEKKLSA